MKYEIKMYDSETLLLDNVFAAPEYLDYAKRHNFNVRFTETGSATAIEIIASFSNNGYEVKFLEEKVIAPDGIVLSPQIVVLLKLIEGKEKITIKEYNKVYIPKMSAVSGFVQNMENELYKFDNREEILRIFGFIGWSEETKETIMDALEAYKKELYERFA